MNDDNLIKRKTKTQDILIEIDNLKKYINKLSNNVRSDKLESFIETMENSITKLQGETENYFNNEINTTNK